MPFQLPTKQSEMVSLVREGTCRQANKLLLAEAFRNASAVTDALSRGNTKYSFTRYNNAYYDQKAGLIEIIDVNGNSWKRE